MHSLFANLLKFISFAQQNKPSAKHRGMNDTLVCPKILQRCNHLPLLTITVDSTGLILYFSLAE